MDALTLDQLLNTLRQQGLHIGIREYSQLQTIFKTQPQLNRDELYELLCVVIAKTAAERNTLYKVFYYLIPADYADTPQQQQQTQDKLKRLHTAQPKASTVTPPAPSPAPSLWQNLSQAFKTYWLQLLLLLSVGIGVAIWHAFTEQDPPPPPKEVTNPQLEQGHHHHKPSATTLPTLSTLDLVREVAVWDVEAVSISSRDKMQEMILPLLILLGSVIGFVWLLAKIIQKTRRRQLPHVAFDPALPNRLKLPPNNMAQPLFDSQQRFQMAWGVSYYLSDAANQDIDLERTVQASATQGLPTVHFDPMRREREVWLWQDAAHHDEQQQRLLQEVAQVLHSLKVEVRRGYFQHVPYQVKDESGNHCYHLYEALPTYQPLLVVCLHSASVNHSFSTAPTETSSSLQQLRQWQHLAIIDCSPPPNTLNHTLRDYQLNSLLPAQLPAWFASQGQLSPVKRPICQFEDINRWAAACALYPGTVQRNEAFALHDALGLNCRWQYQRLGHYASVVRDGYDFRQIPAYLFNTQSPVDRAKALSFWRQRLQRIDQHNHSLDSQWRDSRSRLEHIVLPQALWELWSLQQLEQALAQLLALYEHRPLRRSIRQALGRYSCQHMPQVDAAEQFIQLPYAWHVLDSQTQKQLLDMGFAGQDVTHLQVVWHSANSALLGSLAGLMLLSGYGLWHISQDQDATITTRLDSAAPAHSITTVTQQQAYIGTAQHTLYKNTDIQLSANQTAAVKWQREVEAAQTVLADNAQLWRLATRKQPRPRDNKTIKVSLAVIAEHPQETEVQQLATALLDNGSADQVLISPDWQSYKHNVDSWRNWPNPEQVQWLYIHAKPQRQHHLLSQVALFTGTAKALLDKLKAAPTGLQDLDALGFTTQRTPYLYYQTQQPKLEPIELEHGMKLMPIPAGAFQMGSENGRDSEKPVHTVTIAQPFWMAQTETTFAQYDAYATATGGKLPADEGWGRDTRPVINVDWDDAQGYVRWLSANNAYGLSCRLPSEAEWEYAARAGTTTKYYWGDEIGENNANCDGCGSQWDNKQTAPVGSFAANPWGLYDMSGNVWEWTQDRRHDDYQGAPTNGSAWEDGDSTLRMLRSGSWFSTSDGVRSAFRFSLTLGFNYGGFRVLCSPR